MEVGFQRGSATGGKNDVGQSQEWRASHAIDERVQPARRSTSSLRRASSALGPEPDRGGRSSNMLRNLSQREGVGMECTMGGMFEAWSTGSLWYQLAD